MAKILVVDDEPGLRRTLSCHLAELGHDVTEVDSALAALNRMDAVRPEVVITDVQMPEMDGHELLARLRAVTPDVQVIVMTGHGDASGTIEAMKLGAFDYLSKPLDLYEVEHTIERCLAGTGEGDGPEDHPSSPATSHELCGQHPSMIRLYKAIGSVAGTRATVLVLGETGTGKELVARTLHENGPAPDAPFVAVNCASVPETLLESELFGHVRGSFTGAVSDRRGRFESAGRGTLLLDEIGDTSLAFQAKLLRVLQEGEYFPVGGDVARRTEARIVAATCRSLDDMVERGTFREDLYYRLRVIELRVPPLRERRSDIPPLVRHLLARHAAEAGRRVPAVPPAVMDELAGRPWPGNVRELENLLLRALILCRGAALTLADVGCEEPTRKRRRKLTSSDSLCAVRSLAEGRHLRRVLRDTDGNKSRAARILEVSRPTLDKLIRKHDLVL